MIGPVRGELLKLQRAWSTWIVGGILVLGELLLGYLLLYAVLQAPLPPGEPGAAAAMDELRATLRPENVLPNVLSMIAGLGGALALVLAAMSTAREYDWRTMAILLTQRPARVTLLAAKAAALALVLAIFTVATFAAGAAGSALVAALSGEAAGLPPLADLPGALAAGWLILGAWAALGFCLGILLRGNGLAIGLGLVYALVIETLINGLAFTSDTFEAVARGLLGTNAGALSGAFGEDAPAGFGGQSIGIDPPMAALVLLAYLAGSLIVAALVFARRDVA